jgi:hypothetical protein
MDIVIEYDGSYPNLCGGTLIIIIDNVEFIFRNYSLVSGGSCWMSGDYRDSGTRQGQWSINRWPDNFPEEYKEEVLNEINKQIPYGCCGGCL